MDLNEGGAKRFSSQIVEKAKPNVKRLAGFIASPIFGISIAVIIGLIIIIVWVNYPATIQKRLLESTEKARRIKSLIELRIIEVNPTFEEFSGTTQITLNRFSPSEISNTGPTNGLWDRFKNDGTVQLIWTNSLETRRTTASTNEIDLIQSFGSLFGSDAYSLEMETIKGDFYYPFDQYTLKLGTYFSTVNAIRNTVLYEIGQVEFELSAPNFEMVVGELSGAVIDKRENSISILLLRPLFHQILTVIIGGMSIFLVGHAFVAKIESLIPKSVAFFGGLWSTRAVLLGGYSPKSTLFIDWMMFVLYVTFIIIILIRIYSDQVEKKKTMGTCQYCYSQINKCATYCLYCTQVNPIKGERAADCPPVAEEAVAHSGL